MKCSRRFTDKEEIAMEQTREITLTRTEAVLKLLSIANRLPNDALGELLDVSCRIEDRIIIAAVKVLRKKYARGEPAKP